MITDVTKAEITRLYHAEKWKVGTIAKALGLHHETVKKALKDAPSESIPRLSIMEPFLDFIAMTLESYPEITATRMHQMIKERGFQGSVYPVRRAMKKLKTKRGRAYQSLLFMPGEAAQVDWADFGKFEVSPGIFRRLQCFVMVLAYSRKIFAKIYFDQKMGSLLEAHVAAFHYFGGVPRRIMYDNMKTAVITNINRLVTFNPNLVDLASHYRFELIACTPRAAWEKGRTERAIRYLRDSFAPNTRKFSSIEGLNIQLREWLDNIASQRPWPDDKTKSVQTTFESEQGVLIKLANDYPCYDERFSRVDKMSMLQFDSNRYSVPPEYVGQRLCVRSTSSKIMIYDGDQKIVEHDRSFSKGQKIIDSSHIEQIIVQSRVRSRRQSRESIILRLSCGKELLRSWHDIHENIAYQSKLIAEMIEAYGLLVVETATGIALARNTPRAYSIQAIVEDLATAPSTGNVHFKREDLHTYSTESHELSTYDEI